MEPTDILEAVIIPDKSPAEARIHHRYSPSTLQMRKASPCWDPRSDNESEAAAAGTLQHDAAETGDLSKLTSDEQIEKVSMVLEYVETVKQYFRDRDGKEPLVIKERLLQVDEYDTTAGYNDTAIVSALGDEAEVIDFKFGRWAVEPAETNLQGYSYVLGLAKKVLTLGLPYTLKRCKMTFLLPYRDEIDSHTFEASEFERLMFEVRAVVGRSTNKSLAKQPTIGTCVFCKHLAEGKCEAVTSIMVKVGQKYAPLIIPADVSPTTAAHGPDRTMLMKLTDVAKAWGEGMRSQITLIAIEEGVAPDGYGFKTAAKETVLDPVKFLNVVKRIVPENELIAMGKYPFGAIEDYIGAHSPRGMKTKNKEAFRDALRDEGAVEKGAEYTYLEMLRTDK